MSEKTSWIRQKRWNPYLVGAGIGILSWLVFLLVDKPLGMSTEVSKWSGAVTCVAGGSETVAENAYWKDHTPKFGYSTLLLLGTAVGAFVSALASRDLKAEAVPSVWAEHFGRSPWKRFLGAFLGGFILIFGARMAGGCTSGHGISGSLQLALSGWVFFLTMFASGLLTAWLMFRKR
ncbi:YeeE/YedE thiosulfate transporter family protein [Haloferula sp. A504]|jgi:uncharacterized membrane protein YedE/YeeE|uniref:YeeE/YedE thiosulfate transporter family protein n=1 Tax=Haloferula sp. A504 TaxID=3373601 RepID=UPI0031C20F50|nr:YeeE/YedE family protein [Verrucomicrobiaceae bacterium E54]